MSFEDRLRRDLHSVPVPALRVSDRLADRALAAARRQTWVRAGAIAGLATVAVASAVPSLLGVLPGGGTTAPSTAPGTTPGTATGTAACAEGAPLPSRPHAQAWEYFDPLKREIDASGVAGYQVTAYDTSTYFQTLELRNQARDRLVTVTLYAVNGVPHQSPTGGLAQPFEPQTGEPAGPVRGEPAYWLPETTDAGLPRGQGLAWQWAPGAWVLVTVAGTSHGLGEEPTPSQSTGNVAALRSLAAEIAPQLEFGRGIPVTSPFSMTIPDCTRVSGAGASFEPGPSGTAIARFGLTFETQDSTAATNPLHIPNDAGTIRVHAHWASALAANPGAVFDVDGHPTVLGDCHVDGCAPDTAYGGMIYGVAGFVLDLVGNADLGVSVLGLYEAIQVHPGATNDPATWGDPITP